MVDRLFWVTALIAVMAPWWIGFWVILQWVINELP